MGTSGINIDGYNNTFEDNDVVINFASTAGITLSGTAAYNVFQNNNITATSSGDTGFSISSAFGGNPGNNTLYNNNVTADNGAIDDTASNSNTLLYNTSLGEINWTLGNLTTLMNLSLDMDHVHIGNNSISINNSGYAQRLNGTANIIFYTLSHTVTPQLLLDGDRCDNTNSCNMTYDLTDDILDANVSTMGNYTTQEASSTFPNVTSLIPSVNSLFNVTNVIEIATNVTSDSAVSDVSANISFPNGTSQIVVLSNASTHDDKFNVSFTAPTNLGVYNVTFFGNDSSNNLNSSETSNFTINDVVNTSVGTLVPALNSVYNVSSVIEINATVTDDVNVSKVFVNITYPNGTNDNTELTLDGSNVYNTTFTAPALIGLYNLTFFANDSSGNENRTEVSNFSINDVVNPTIVDVIPVINSIYNTSTTIEISVNVTDDVNISAVLANITYPNTTINQLTLSLDSGNRFNTTFAIPSVNETYNITFIVNDTTNNINSTNTSNFTATTLDFDNDGVEDSSDNLIGNESNVNGEGIGGLNISINENITNGSFTGLQNVTFYNNSTLLMNFTHNFSASQLDLRNITLNLTSTSFVVNMSGQLGSDINKTLFLTDDSYTSICVEDAEITSDADISSGCDGNNETDFTTCLGVSTGTNLSGLTCYDEGSTIRVENLQFSGIRGATTSSSSSSSSSSSGGGGSSTASSSGGGGLPPVTTPIEVISLDSRKVEERETSSEPPRSSEEPSTTKTEPSRRRGLTGFAFLTGATELGIKVKNFVFGLKDYWAIITIVFLSLGSFAYGTRTMIKYKKRQHTIIHKPQPQVVEVPEKISKLPINIHGKMNLGERMDSVLRTLKKMGQDGKLVGVRKKVIKNMEEIDGDKIKLDSELQDVNKRLHGYHGIKPQVISEPEGKKVWDEKLINLDNELQDVEKGIASSGKIISQIPFHDDLDKSGMANELNVIDKVLAKGSSKPFSLVNQLFKKKEVHVDTPEEIKAREEVIRISKEIEGDNPIPKNESLDIQEDLKQLNQGDLAIDNPPSKFKVINEIKPREHVGYLQEPQQNEPIIPVKKREGLWKRFKNLFKNHSKEDPIFEDKDFNYPVEPVQEKVVDDELTKIGDEIKEIKKLTNTLYRKKK